MPPHLFLCCMSTELFMHHSKPTFNHTDWYKKAQLHICIHSSFFFFVCFFFFPFFFLFFQKHSKYTKWHQVKKKHIVYWWSFSRLLTVIVEQYLWVKKNQIKKEYFLKKAIKSFRYKVDEKENIWKIWVFVVARGETIMKIKHEKCMEGVK